MVPIERHKFIIDLVEAVKGQMLSKVGSMPEEWNGIQLRQYISDCFASQVHRMTRTQKRDYNNDIITRNI